MAGFAKEDHHPLVKSKCLRQQSEYQNLHSALALPVQYKSNICKVDDKAHAFLKISIKRWLWIYLYLYVPLLNDRDNKGNRPQQPQ
jgi:hypothetical protein